MSCGPWQREPGPRRRSRATLPRAKLRMRVIVGRESIHAAGGTKTMRILIADDHPIVRHGLKQYLASDPELNVIGEATNGSDFLELARKTEWDVALMDFTMP